MKNFYPRISELTEISEIHHPPAAGWEVRRQYPIDVRGWILYDGECQFCIAAANRFHDLFARRGFVFLPLQTEWVQRRLGLLPGAPLEEMRVLTIEGDNYGGADAVLFLVKQIWWLRPIAWLGHLPLAHEAIDRGYIWVAAHRGCTHLQCAFKERRSPSSIAAFVAYAPPVLSLTAVLITRPNLESWVFMWLMVASVFLSAKWLTLQHAKRRHRVSVLWQVVYLLLWPGMDARNFLAGKRRPQKSAHQLPNIGGALAKISVGALLLWGVARHLSNDLLAGWIGMIGLILMIHFGLFSLATVCWRFLGYPARPIMNAPWRAALLSDFWGKRWNRAFQQLVIDILFRPLASSLGVVRATLTTFFISGLLHELVISLPAGAGYGLPTAYFLLQGWGLIAQRTSIDGRGHFAKGVSGRFFTLSIVAAPAFFLFHPPFVHGVIVPFLHAIGAL